MIGATVAPRPARTLDGILPQLARGGVCPPGFTGSLRAFPGVPDQVAVVRRFVRSECGDHPASGDTALVASELAANAIAHSRSGDVGVFIVHLCPVSALRIALIVTDQGGPAAPQVQPAVADAECGRGLKVVTDLASTVLVIGDCDMRSVAVLVPASSGSENGDDEMTEPGDEISMTSASGVPPIPVISPGWVSDSALSAVREFLAATVDSINPGTPARELLSCLVRYRAHLSAIVAEATGG
jgi:anti-sigma regulatory factor (Ser/Thr protein kinase)